MGKGERGRCRRRLSVCPSLIHFIFYFLFSRHITGKTGGSVWEEGGTEGKARVDLEP